MAVRPLVRGAAAGAAALTLLLPTTPAGAATDTTPPSLTAVARFEVGSVLTPLHLGGTGDPAQMYAELTQRVAWTAGDASGICGVDLQRTYPGREPSDVLTGTTATSYVGTITDYDGSFGGGSQVPDGWLVVAHDCAGNTAQVQLYSRPGVYQEDGTSFSPNGIIPTLRYSGAWAVSHCACAAGGSQATTSRKGAAVTVVATYDRGSYVGLVMAKGPGRGKARISLDGAPLTTVDTYAPSNVNRVVVFSKWLTAGRHTLTVVDRATAGRPRIDLDAVVISANPPL